MSMNCDRARETVENLIDGRIGAEDEAELRKHAESCPACAAALAQASAFISAMTDSLAAARPSGKLMDNLLETLREEPQPVAPAPPDGRAGWKLATAASLLLSAGLIYMLNSGYQEAGSVRNGTKPGAKHVGKGPATNAVGKLVRGRVETRTDPRSSFRTIKPGSQLVSGTTLRVLGNQPAEVMLADRVKVLLDAGSEAIFAPDAASPFDLCLVKGRTHADVVTGTPFTVYTELGSVRSLGTRFGVALANDKQAGEGMGVNVRRGVVRVTALGVSENLRAGNCLFVGRRLTLRCSNGEVCGTSLGWTSGPASRVAPPVTVRPADPPPSTPQQAAPALPPGTKAQPKNSGRQQATPAPARTPTTEQPSRSKNTEEHKHEDKTAAGVDNSGGESGRTQERSEQGVGSSRPLGDNLAGTGEQGQPDEGQREDEIVRKRARPSRRRGSGRRSRHSKARSIRGSSSRSGNSGASVKGSVKGSGKGSRSSGSTSRGGQKAKSSKSGGK